MRLEKNILTGILFLLLSFLPGVTINLQCKNMGGRYMKDFIVLIATVILGVLLAGLILGLRSAADEMKDKALQEIENVFSSEEVLRV